MREGRLVNDSVQSLGREGVKRLRKDRMGMECTEDEKRLIRKLVFEVEKVLQRKKKKERITIHRPQSS